MHGLNDEAMAPVFDINPNFRKNQVGFSGDSITILTAMAGPNVAVSENKRQSLNQYLVCFMYR